MIKLWNRSVQKELSNKDFQLENPKFEVFYKNKKWQGVIQGWKTNSPILKISRLERGKLVQELIFDLSWEFLKKSWVKTQGKISI